MIHVFIAGWFGSGNVGDEAIQLAELELLTKSLAPCAFDLLSFDLERSRRLLTEYPQVERLVRVGSRRSLHRTDVWGLFRSLNRADLVLIGGGGLFQDLYNWYFPPFFATLALTAKLLGKPLALFGVGVGPLRGRLGRNATRLAARLADLIVVRDEPSARELEQLGVGKNIHVTADLALSLPPAPSQRGRALLHTAGMPKSPQPLVAVVLQRLLPWNGQQAHVLAAALDHVIETWGAQIVFIPFGQYALDAAEHDDKASTDLTTALHVHEQMKHRTEAALLRTRHSPPDLMAAIGQCDLVLSMRYHGLVMAAAMGVPCIALTYRAENKLRSFMTELGSPDDVLEMETLSRDTLESHLDAALQDSESHHQVARKRARALVEHSHKNEQLLVRFIRESQIHPSFAASQPQRRATSGN
jgi:polysaccharide pyruvyl transferase CsaB